MGNFLKSFKESSFAKSFHKRYIPLYVLAVLVMILGSAYFLMQQTDFAQGTSVREYLEGAGVIPETENTDEGADLMISLDKNGDPLESDEIVPEQEKDDIDSGYLIENPEDEDGAQDLGVISTDYPTIISVKDGVGNVNYSSFGQENTGKWKNPTIKVEQVLNVSITANNPNDSTLYYKFEYQKPGGSYETLQNWSTNRVMNWTVPSDALGKWMYIMVLVKDSDGELRFDTSDDYTYLTYEVNPKGVAQKIYATIVNTSDSNGNVNPNSWGSNEGGSWSDGEPRGLNVGDTVSFHISATDPNGDSMQYMFMIQQQGGGFESLRDWSASNSYTWTVPEDLAGTTICILSGVKDPDEYLRYGSMGDDYNYMFYTINSL